MIFYRYLFAGRSGENFGKIGPTERNAAYLFAEKPCPFQNDKAFKRYLKNEC